MLTSEIFKEGTILIGKTSPTIDKWVGIEIIGEVGRRSIKEMLPWPIEAPVVFPAIVTIHMPCGKDFVFNGETFPKETMPCPCGNPKEFVVNYS